MHYIVWLTLLTPNCSEKIIIEMIKRGYTIGPLQDKILSQRDDVSDLICFKVSIKEATNPISIYKDIEDIISHNMILKYSIVICLSTDCYFSGSNIVLQKPNHTTTLN